MPSPEVTIRPIRAADLELEKEFVEGLSPVSAYQRLMSARRLTPDELRRLTDIDHQREVALIATVPVDGRERQVGVARYVRDPARPEEADFAIVVSDGWQRRGLGARLLQSLIDAARRGGVRRLTGMTFSDNVGMLRLAHRLGFRTALDPEGASVSVLSLDL